MIPLAKIPRLPVPAETVVRFGLALVLGGTLILSGCITMAARGPDRVPRFRPRAESAQVGLPVSSGVPSGIRPAVSGTGTVASATVVSTNTGGNPTAEVVRVAGRRELKEGDKVLVHFRSIPNPESVNYVIDDRGEVNLPHIGKVRVAGRSTSEAETMIQQAYVDGGIYKKITVIIVAQEDEYFVRGEVKREGRYPMSGDLSLLQAITTAGGYTEYADPTKINIIRGAEVIVVNLQKVEQLKEKDVSLKPGDIVVVKRRWL